MAVEKQGRGCNMPLELRPHSPLFVFDKCPGCGPGDLDIYDGNGTGKTGRCAIAWKAVDCPTGVRDSLFYIFEGSNQWWLKLQV